MPTLADRNDCTGCAACANVCPKSAICMQPDGEGFLQPAINQALCVECKLCEKRCPVLHPVGYEGVPKAYAVISYKDRQSSSSGGAFSMFARYVLARGGVVFGSTIDERLSVFHIKIERVEELSKIRGSKYVQSAIKDAYKQAKEELKKSRMVLFSGTPCQIAGLYAFLGKRYDDLLITLDLVCHGVPNQATFDSYLKKLKKSTRLSTGNGNIEGFRFRKLDSWDYRPAVKFSESKWQILDQEDNAYMAAFFKGITYRESCFHCKYANLQRIGDFTIADFWGIGRHGKGFKKNVASGVSLVIDNRNKMDVMLEKLSKYAYIEERDIEEAIIENGNLKAPVRRLPLRNTSVLDLLNKSVSLKDYSRQYNLSREEDLRFFIDRYAKKIVYALGLYNVYKTISYKFGK